MASSKANKKRTKKACNAMKLLGISERNVRLALKRLLKAYENDWTHIEEENYRVLIDAIFEHEEPMVINNNNDTQSRLGRVEEPMVINNNNNDTQSRLGRVEEPMVTDKPTLEHFLNHKRLRFDSEAVLPDFSLYVELKEDEEDEEDEEPLIRKKPRTRNRPSSPAGSSVPVLCTSEMQQMVEHDLGAMDIIERDMPKLIHIYRRRVSNVTRTEKVQHDFSFSGDSGEEEIEAPSQDRPSSPADCYVPCSSNYVSELHKNMDDKGNENEVEDEIVTHKNMDDKGNENEVEDEIVTHKNMDTKGNENEVEDEIVTSGLSQIDIVSSSNGEVKLALSICKPSLGFRLPSLDAVMKLVEERYQKNFQGLGVDFTLSDLFKEVCDCFVEQGNVSDGNNQSLVQTFDNLMEAEMQCGQFSLSTTPSDHTDAPVPIPGYAEQGNVSDGSNQSLVQAFEDLMEAEKQCGQLSLSNAPPDHTDAPVPIPRYVEQGNVSDGSNRSLVQNFENFMEAEKQCCQLSLSNTPPDHTDAPVPIPRYVEQGNVSDGSNRSLVQNFENFMEAEKQCCQLSLSTTPSDHTNAPVPIPKYAEQGNVSDGNNQSLVQTFENLMEAETLCGQLSLSTTPSDHTDAPVPIPRYVVSSPFTNIQVVNGVYSDVFNRTFRKQNTPVVCNLSDSISLTLCLKDDSFHRGFQANLQVFMTAEGKGWGLRTLEDLPKGTFVCKYVGEIVSNTELFEQNEQNTDEKHTYPVLLDEGFLKDEEALCLDGTSFENVARFINHRCEDANLVAIPVKAESPDHHHYHHAFFTARDVKAMEELTWDYGIDFNDDSHPVKAFHCKCGSGNCRQTKHKNEANMVSDKQLIARIQ